MRIFLSLFTDLFVCLTAKEKENVKEAEREREDKSLHQILSSEQIQIQALCTCQIVSIQFS